MAVGAENKREENELESKSTKFGFEWESNPRPPEFENCTHPLSDYVSVAEAR